MSKRDEFVEIAKSQVGVRETGVNNVKYNTWYYGREVNGTPGTSEYAWCVVFESWCANEVGILNTLVPKENNVGKLMDWYESRNLYHTSNYSPKKGDLVVFNNGKHTGIVEYVDNQVHTIEGNSGDKVARHTYSIWGSITGYCEVEFDDSTSSPDTPSGNTTIKYIQETLNNRYNTGLVVDGYYGPQTKKGLVKGLQSELNTQYEARLSVDGIFGPATKSKCPNVKKGARGNITWLIQAMLYCKGYNTNGVDGIYGNGTFNAVKLFQKNNGLIDDGIVGKNTFEKLFN